MSDIAIKFSYFVSSGISPRHFRASAGSYVLHGRISEGKTSISCGFIDIKGEITIDIPFDVADWYCDLCAQEGRPSADLTNKNLPNIREAFKLAHPDDQKTPQPFRSGAKVGYANSSFESVPDQGTAGGASHPSLG